MTNLGAERVRRSRRNLVVGALAIAAAAALVVRFGPLRPAKTVTNYLIDVAATDTTLGSSPTAAGEPVRISLRGHLNVDLRPTSGETSRDPVRVDSYLRHDGQINLWTDVRPELVGRDLKLHAPVADLPQLAPGRWDLVFVIGHPDQLPSLDEVRAAVEHGETHGQGWLLRLQSIEITP